MNIDWTKYPPLPEPPVLPEWRDTPEREAYFEELVNKNIFSRIGYAVYSAALIAVIVGACLAAGPSYSVWGNWLCAAGGMVLGLSLVYLFVQWLYWRIKLLKKYGFYLWKLRRPNVSGAVAAIMTARPDFDATEFRKYWPTPELADMALEIRRWVMENWALPDKMLYPNDSLMLLYEYKLTGNAEDYEDNFGELWADDALFDYGNVFADLLEMTLASRIAVKQGRKKGERP